MENLISSEFDVINLVILKKPDMLAWWMLMSEPTP